MGRTEKSIKNALAGVVLQISTVLLSFVSRKVFLMNLGIDNLGLNALLSGVISVLSLSELGVYSAMTYALYEPLSNSNWVLISKIMTLFKRIYTAIAFVIIGLGLCVLPFLSYIVGKTELSHQYIVYIYCLTVLQTATSYFLSYKRSLIVADQKEYIVYKWDILAKYIIVFGEIVIISITKSFSAYLYFSIVAIAAQNLIMSRIVDKQYPQVDFSIKDDGDNSYRKKLFGNIRYLFLNRLSGTISSSADSILLSMFSGLSYSGMYSNYNSINSNLEGVITKVCYGCSASMGNLLTEGKKEEAKNILKEITFVVFILVCVCCNCLYTLSTPFIATWFGEAYTIADAFLVLLIVIFFLRTMRYPGMIATDATGLFKVDKNVAIIAMLLNIISSIVFAMKIGYIGIFVGTVIAQLVVLFGKLYVFYNIYLKESWMQHVLYVFALAIFTGITSFVSRWLCSFVVCDSFIVRFILSGVISTVFPLIGIVGVFYRSVEFKRLAVRIKRLMKK